MSGLRFTVIVVWLVLALTLAQFGAVQLFASPNSNFDEKIRPFFAQHCSKCHGADEQNGDRRFDTLAFPIADDNALSEFQDVLDQLNLGEMPPEDEPQPTGEEKAAVIQWFTEVIAEQQAQRGRSGSETTLRRLNRREYLYTIGDLLNINVRGFDPTATFPADQTVHHLDNQGDVLVTSGFLLDQYLKAAESVMNKALLPLEKPPVEKWEFAKRFVLQPELGGNGPNRRPDYITLFEHPKSDRHLGSYGFLGEFTKGTPHDGFYEIEIDAEALYRHTPLKKNYSRINPDEPLILAVVTGDAEYGVLHNPQPIEPELLRVELEDGRQTVKGRIWLDQGATPRFIYPNGSSRARQAMIEAAKELLGPKKAKGMIGQKLFKYGLAHAKIPQIRIHRVALSGPHYDQWPTRTQITLLGGKQFDPARRRGATRRFLARAYRRPPTKDETDRVMSVVRAREAAGRTPYEAYREGLMTALCSPGFLYLDEPSAQTADRLDGHAIAARLSYFLWSSLPDARLTQLAANDKLHQPKVLLAQVDRMLADPKSDRFIRGFIDTWLTLDALGDTPPDPNQFREYYANDLRNAMYEETRLYTRYMLDEEVNIDRFIDSDFTFANSALAKMYGLDVELKSRGFEKVSTENAPRGGLLGHASVLTVTANGVDTSPIVRGVWLLENILGTPPSPPPPDVEPLDPDVRGAVSIRDQMEKHRTNAACATCHRKIDPLGFALENFDAIGRYRSRYKGVKAQIDASGELPGGEKFNNVQHFKNVLLGEKDKFARAMTEKLFAYALGRGMDISDRPEIDSILEGLDDHGRTMRYLIDRVVTSPQFISP